MASDRATTADIASLLERFAFESSRYAWYPTPSRFSAAFAAERARAAPSRAPATRPRPMALAICLPEAAADVRALLECLEREAALVAASGLGPAQAFGVHGLQEAVLAAPAFAAFLAALDRRFGLERAASLAELDASRATPRALERIAKAGFGRVRLRCRSDAEQEALAPALAAAHDTLGAAADASLEHARAGQSPRSLAAAVDAAARAGARCIVLNGNLARAEPEPRRRAAALAAALEALAAAGYAAAGLDVFALPSTGTATPFHSRFDVVGLGPGALSSHDDWYAQNEEDASRYAAAVRAGRLPVARGHRLSADDKVRREVIHGLECLGAVGFSWIENKYRIEFAAYFAEELARLEALQEEGLVELYQDAIEVAAEARPLARLASAVFDRYLAAAAPRMNARST